MDWWPEAISGICAACAMLGERFLFGAMLYIGPRAYRVDERLHVPVDRIWWPV